MNLVAEVSGSADGKRFLCKGCGHKAKFISVMKKHIQRRHSSARPFRCLKCDGAFKHQDDLKSHYLGQHGERHTTEEIMLMKQQAEQISSALSGSDPFF